MRGPMQLAMLAESDSNHTLLLSEFSAATERRFVAAERRLESVETRMDGFASDHVDLSAQVQ